MYWKSSDADIILSAGGDKYDENEGGDNNGDYNKCLCRIRKSISSVWGTVSFLKHR